MGEEKIKLLKIYDNESGREIFPIGYEPLEPNISCLLYTSDAADEL